MKSIKWKGQPNFWISNKNKIDRELRSNALPKRANPQTNLLSDGDYDMMGDGCPTLKTEISNNQLDLDIEKLIPKYQPLQEPLIKAFNIPYLEQELIVFPEVCDFTDTLISELY
jgi:hypothetical protein